MITVSVILFFPETRSHDFTPRLFQLASITGEFLATEVLNPSRNNLTEAFPFLQCDLYSVEQPGVLYVGNFAL